MSPVQEPSSENGAWWIGAREPIYSVHYNRHTADAMGVGYQYDVGFQRQS